MKRILIFLFISISYQSQSQNKDSISLKINKLQKKHELRKDNYQRLKAQEKYNEDMYKQYRSKVIEERMIRLQEQSQLEEKLELEKIEEVQKEVEHLETQIETFAQEKMLEIIEEEHELVDSMIYKGKKVARLKGPSQFDSRIEPIQLSAHIDWQRNLLTISESVGMLVEVEKLTQISKTVFQLDITQSLGEVYNLCKDESFYSQPSVGVGTTFITDIKHMMTALHVFERPLKYYAVVFDYQVISSNGVVNAFIDIDDIYYPETIVKKDDDLDIAEFTVDRNFNRPQLEWEPSKDISSKENEVYAMGYPNGIPLKIALNASILDNSHWMYFYTSLDSFQGNSGSPVFNFFTNKVIGVLVSGERDYRFNGQCNQVASCKYPYCEGEKIIRIETILNL